MISKLSKKPSSRTYGGLTEQERINARRERFLEAGLEVFGTIGLRGATVRVLCKEAGLTERYFYESFQDAEALFCAVYDKQMTQFSQFFLTQIPDMPRELEERIRMALGLYFTAMRDSKMVRVLYLEAMVGSQNVVAKHHTTTRVYTDLLAHLIRSDNPDIDISHDFAVCVGTAVNGACSSMAVQWMMDDYSTPQELLVEACYLLVLGTMRALKEECQPA